MFGFFKSKKKGTRNISANEVAEKLFAQILSARDEAKAGGIIDEKTFNDRLNHMYSGGYLIGYVDRYLAEMAGDDETKRDVSRQIFEQMFPGTGFDFVRAKLMIRQKVTEIDPESKEFKAGVVLARSFDQGLDDGLEEAGNCFEEKGRESEKLKSFLLLGEIKFSEPS